MRTALAKKHPGCPSRGEHKTARDTDAQFAKPAATGCRLGHSCVHAPSCHWHLLQLWRLLQASLEVGRKGEEHGVHKGLCYTQTRLHQCRLHQLIHYDELFLDAVHLPREYVARNYADIQQTFQRLPIYGRQMPQKCPPQLVFLVAEQKCSCRDSLHVAPFPPPPYRDRATVLRRENCPPAKNGPACPGCQSRAGRLCILEASFPRAAGASRSEG